MGKMARQDLTDVPIEYIVCHTLRHSWVEFSPLMRPPQFGWRLSLTCPTCTAERHDLISKVTGDLIQREYRYPEGYKFGYRVPIEELRKMLYRSRKVKALAG